MTLKVGDMAKVHSYGKIRDEKIVRITKKWVITSISNFLGENIQIKYSLDTGFQIGHFNKNHYIFL